VGWLLVDSVEPIASLDSLTDADARADGFANVGELKRALRQIYPQAKTDGRNWFKVSFRVDPRVDPTAELLQAVNAALLRRHRAEMSSARRRGANC